MTAVRNAGVQAVLTGDCFPLLPDADRHNFGDMPELLPTLLETVVIQCVHDSSA